MMELLAFISGITAGILICTIFKIPQTDSLYKQIRDLQDANRRIKELLHLYGYEENDNERKNNR